MRVCLIILSLMCVETIADLCPDWFNKAKVRPGPDCIEKCASLSTGMDTYFCPQECPTFCGQRLKLDSKWRSKLKDGRPKKWHTKYEKSKKWAPEEIARVIEALQTLPENLRARLGNLYRLDSSIFGDNPGQEDEGDVVVYNSAFSDENNLARVLAHELSHIWYRKLSKEERSSYLSAAQWSQGSKGQNAVGRPKNTFLKKHGRDSPSEDFSINVEHYLYEPSKLKQVTPRVFEWIDGHYGSWLHFEK